MEGRSCGLREKQTVVQASRQARLTESPGARRPFGVIPSWAETARPLQSQVPQSRHVGSGGTLAKGVSTAEEALTSFLLGQGSGPHRTVCAPQPMKISCLWWLSSHSRHRKHHIIRFLLTLLLAVPRGE